MNRLSKAAEPRAQAACIFHYLEQVFTYTAYVQDVDAGKKEGHPGKTVVASVKVIWTMMTNLKEAFENVRDDRLSTRASWALKGNRKTIRWFDDNAQRLLALDPENIDKALVKHYGFVVAAWIFFIKACLDGNSNTGRTRALDSLEHTLAHGEPYSTEYRVGQVWMRGTKRPGLRRTIVGLNRGEDGKVAFVGFTVGDSPDVDLQSKAQFDNWRARARLVDAPMALDRSLLN